MTTKSTQEYGSVNEYDVTVFVEGNLPEAHTVRSPSPSQSTTTAMAHYRQQLRGGQARYEVRNHGQAKVIFTR